MKYIKSKGKQCLFEKSKKLCGKDLCWALQYALHIDEANMIKAYQIMNPNIS